MTVLSRHLERVAQEGNTKIRETQAAECVIFLAELSELPVTHVLNLRIKGMPLYEWLEARGFNVGRIKKQAREALYNPS